MVDVVEVRVVGCGKTSRMVKKHDDLRVLMSGLEDIKDHRLVNSCLSGLWQNEELDPSIFYEIDINNYSSKCEMEIESAYLKLKDVLNKLLNTTTTLPIDQSGTFLVASLITEFTYNDAKLELAVRFNKHTIPLISGHMPRGCFNYYDSRMDKVATSKRYILAEYLQSRYWELKKSSLFRVTIAQLRKEINCEDEYYRRTDFINKLIKPTLQELEEIRGDKLTVTRIRNMLEFTGEINTIN